MITAKSRSAGRLPVFVVFFLAVCVNQLNAQGFILEPQYLKSNGTIVREMYKDQWLLCNSYLGMSDFCFVSTNNSQIPCYNNDDGLYVNDFEILNDRFVYFCGEERWSYYYVLGDSNPFNIEDSIYEVTYDTILYQYYSAVIVTRRRAIFGYFDISDTVGIPTGGFLSIPTVFDFGIKLASLDKLVVQEVPDGIHVYMTGKPFQGKGCLLDATANAYIPTSWTIYYDTLENEEMNDVAVSQNNLLCTSRNADTGYINYFPLPASSSSTNIYGPITRHQLGYSADDTILLEIKSGDDFFSATYSVSNGGITVNYFNGLNHLNTFVLFGFSSLHPSLHLKDIKYNANSHYLNILQYYYFDSLSYGSVIWPVDHSLFSVGGPIDGFMYDKQALQSIICLLNNPDHTMASGFDINWNHVAKLYQHKLHFHVRCDREKEYYFEPTEPNIRTMERIFEYDKYEPEIKQTDWQKHMLPWDYDCFEEDRF